jgi:tetratricopeptide (TPR) repeat protein
MIGLCRRIVFVACCLVVAGAGGCKKEARDAAAPPPAAQSSGLSSRLNAMAPAAQIDTLRGLIAADTSNTQLRFFAGNAYYSYGSGLEETAPTRAANLDSAVVQYQRAVTIDSTMSKAWVNMGLTYQEQHNIAEARKALKRAIEVNPNDVLAYCHLGYISHVSGDLTEAMRQYNLALAIDPASPQAHYNLGLAFAEAKIFDVALREWNLVVKNDPDGELGKTAAENVRIIQQYNAKP